GDGARSALGASAARALQSGPNPPYKAHPRSRPAGHAVAARMLSTSLNSPCPLPFGEPRGIKKRKPNAQVEDQERCQKALQGHGLRQSEVPSLAQAARHDSAPDQVHQDSARNHGAVRRGRQDREEKLSAL